MSEDTMTESATHGHGPGCTEFTTSRRRFLQGATAIAGGAALSTVQGGVFRQVAFAAGGTAPNVLVLLSLRGGVDGLSLVVPYGDDDYYEARKSIAVPKNQLLAGDGMFGLHPAMEPLKGMWTGGRFGAVHAVGLSRPNRSHFAAMEEMEDADTGSPERRGWLNRMIGLDTTSNPLEAVQLGSPTVPTSLYGRAPVVATRSLRDLRVTGSRDARIRKNRSLHRTWDRAGGSLGVAARSALSTSGRVARLAETATQPPKGAGYPAGDLGYELAETARLIRADVGVQFVTLDYGNWDMHVNLGNEGQGEMAKMTGELAQALAAFFVDLGTLASRVTVVTISEFGRRVQENGNHGLDHGYGNVMLLLGAGVKGGRVHNDNNWPGLKPDDLIDGDLRVTTDYRSVLAAVLRSRFSVDASRVFPGFTPEYVDVMR